MLKAKHGLPNGPTAVCPSSSGSHIHFYALPRICAFPSASSSSLCDPTSCHHVSAPASPWPWVTTTSWQGLVFPTPKYSPALLVCFITVLIWPLLETKAGQERRRRHAIPPRRRVRSEGRCLKPWGLLLRRCL